MPVPSLSVLARLPRRRDRLFPPLGPSTAPPLPAQPFSVFSGVNSTDYLPLLVPQFTLRSTLHLGTPYKSITAPSSSSPPTMPPAKSSTKAGHDDLKTDGAHGKEKSGLSAAASSSKMRRITSTTGPQSRDNTNSGQGKAAAASSSTSKPSNAKEDAPPPGVSTQTIFPSTRDQLLTCSAPRSTGLPSTEKPFTRTAVSTACPPRPATPAPTAK